MTTQINSKNAFRTALAIGMLAGVCGMASADGANSFEAVITADNHYAVYASTGNVFSYHGGNELGAAGNPGTYNWSEPETYTVSGDLLFLAAWSDDSVAQGLLAQVVMNGNDSLDSGDPRWQVYATGENRGDGDAHPLASDIGVHVAFADANNLWETPYVGAGNGIAPWGTVPGIGAGPKWMWWNTPNDANPLDGGSGAGEMLIFRTNVPTPGSVALASLAGLVCLRRRR